MHIFIAKRLFVQSPNLGAWDADDVIDNDLILVWGSQRRIITGSDLLGRLLRGIVSIEASNLNDNRECDKSGAFGRC
jgi:hypothetical protein